VFRITDKVHGAIIVVMQRLAPQYYDRNAA
jgi:hypothetical protein